MADEVMLKSEIELLEIAKAGIVQVSFTKKDGTNRILNGTLSEKIIPKSDETHGRSKKEGLIVLWDIEKNGWRSFNVEQINWYTQIHLNHSSGDAN
jgi:hypothetical protein